MNLEPLESLMGAAWYFLMAAAGIAGGILVRQARPSGIHGLIAALGPFAGQQCSMTFC